MRVYKLKVGEGTGPASAGPVSEPDGLSTIAYCPVLPPTSLGNVLSEHARLNRDQPVDKVEHFRRDSRVKKLPKPGEAPIGGVRGIIREFSDQSMARLLFCVKNCDANFFSMMTLTYPREFPSDGRKVKDHFKAFRQSFLARHPADRGIWWMEFQKRGAPHFHVVTTVDLASMSDKSGIDLVWRPRPKSPNGGYWTFVQEENWLSKRWDQIVDSGDPAHLKAGCAWEVIECEEGALRYTAAHAAKRKQKKVPAEYQSVGRAWGRIGLIDIEKFGESQITAAEVFEIVGAQGLSSRGRLKKYLYDASNKFSYGL